ncbi:uncharacterized protein [Macrobrachium rosenbergii]|uniref:uncharacterized protein n=1 Tax=Macrobrachium rosenbergii TaxID=79674 RepID=UPI0034D3F2F5
MVLTNWPRRLFATGVLKKRSSILRFRYEVRLLAQKGELLFAPFQSSFPGFDGKGHRCKLAEKTTQDLLAQSSAPCGSCDLDDVNPAAFTQDEEALSCRIIFEAFFEERTSRGKALARGPLFFRLTVHCLFQAVAIVALGKMCLQHEEQAKRIIPALGKMLDTKICPALRINIVFTLSDMCVRGESVFRITSPCSEAVPGLQSMAVETSLWRSGSRPCFYLAPPGSPWSPVSPVWAVSGDPCCGYSYYVYHHHECLCQDAGDCRLSPGYPGNNPCLLPPWCSAASWLPGPIIPARSLQCGEFNRALSHGSCCCQLPLVPHSGPGSWPGLAPVPALHESAAHVVTPGLPGSCVALTPLVASGSLVDVYAAQVAPATLALLAAPDSSAAPTWMGDLTTILKKMTKKKSKKRSLKVSSFSSSSLSSANSSPSSKARQSKKKKPTFHLVLIVLLNPSSCLNVWFQCLTDDHEEMRSTVLFYITERLLKRFPKILCQHFIECIFHYNCYEEHESYNRFTQSSKEKELFSLAGKEHMEDRMMIYKFMLDHMQDEQRFTTTHRLIQDVLGGLVDGRIKLSPGSLPMLEDTLNVLRSDEIKLASLKSRPEDTDQPADQAEEAAMAGMVIKLPLITQVVKRSVIENVVPILIAVKHKLEEHRSPLMKHLLLYFKELMKDYKNEIKEILAGDKQLAQEIEFDLKRFDQEEKEREEEELRRKQAEKEVAADDQDADAGECANDLEKSVNLGTSPSLRKNGPGMTPKTPTAVQNKLHKLALLNSKAITNRRRSSLLPVPFNQDSDSNVNSLETRASHSQNAAQAQTPKVNGERENVQTPEASDVERRPSSDEEVRKEARPDQEEEDLENKASEKNIYPLIPGGGENSPARNIEGTPKAKTLKSTRDKLLRAISTPHHKPGVISNITFIDETQDLSAITVNSSAVSLQSGTEQPKLVLHLQSPEAFAKESEFSRLRRASRESEQRSEPKGKATKSIRKSNPEIFESHTSFGTEADSDNSDLVPENQSAQKEGVRVEEAVSKGKRTRDMASLGPYTKSGELEKNSNQNEKSIGRRKWRMFSTLMNIRHLARWKCPSKIKMKYQVDNVKLLVIKDTEDQQVAVSEKD